MSKGVLIFAFNNDHIDYLAMANWSAENIRRHLDLPVCVVTDITDIPSNYKFDYVVQAVAQGIAKRHFSDINITVPWYNANRVDAYECSPWETTLVLDADYVVASDQLKILFKADQDFLCHRWSYDVTDQQAFDDLNYFGRYKMPMWWATVMLFRRSIAAELIFDSMRMIKDNWTHYRNLYSNNRSTYRNDHALTIALGIVNGHILNHADIPWRLSTVVPDHKLSIIKQDCYRIDFLTQQKQPRHIDILNQDFHAMGKSYLGEIIAHSI